MTDNRKDATICKRQRQEKEVVNFFPITCLPIIWNVLTGMISENLYKHLEKAKVLPD